LTTPAPDAVARALEVLAATPPILRALAEAGSAETLARRPSPEGWSAREVLAHLWRTETFLGSRIRSILEQDEPELGPPAYGQAPAELGTLLDEWEAARARNLALFRSLTTAQHARAGRHPRHGRITIGVHVAEAAYHDLDHLRQVMAGWQVELYPSIGSFQGLYPPPG
jgi:hypothetical protein